ncbi:MAG: thioredoxin [Opitutales bacterium]
MSEKIENLNISSFKEAISSPNQPVLVDFWAPWCGPCKAIAPILEELAEEMQGVVKICKVDVDENGEVAAEYNVRAIPTLILFKDGAMVEQMVGMINKDELKSKITTHA